MSDITFNLNENSPRCEQPKNLTIKLKPHQLAILHRAKYLETNTVDTEIDGYVAKIDVNMGVIGDKVGSGKSYVFLGLLENEINFKRDIYRIHSTYHNHCVSKPPVILQCVSRKKFKQTPALDINVLVVPLGVINQWKKYVEKDSNIKFYIIKKWMDLRKLLIEYQLDDLEDNPDDDSKKKRKKKNNKNRKKKYYNLLSDNQYYDYSLNRNTLLHHTSSNHPSAFFQNKDYLLKLGKLDLNKLSQYKLLLVSPSFYNELSFYFNFDDLKIQRLCFDEADSLNIPNCQRINCNFTWFITSSLKNIQHPSGWNIPVTRTYRGYNGVQRTYQSYKRVGGIHNNGFIKSVCQNIESWSMRKYIFLQNEEKFIKMSFKLPEIVFHTIFCMNTRNINILNGVVSQEIMNMLNGGDINGAIQRLDIPVKNVSNVIHGATMKLNIELENLKIELEGKQRKTYSSDNAKKKSIASTQIKIKDIENKIKCIQDRINDTDSCCICYDDEMTMPTIVKCCQKTMCFECITMTIAQMNKCPYCRSKLTTNDLIVMSEENLMVKEEEEEEEIELNLPNIKNHSEKYSKEDNFKRIVTWIVNNHSVKSDELLLSKMKLLVFSEYSATFNQKYIDTLNTLGLKYNRVKGTVNSINITINKYKNEDTDVLFLNSKYFGSGLNLENTTDIIITHKMDSELEKQVIGRAQRVGRETPLNVWKLYYQNER